MLETQTLMPTRKVLSGSVVGTALALLILILNTYVPFFQARPLSAELSAMATTLVSAIVAWMIPPGRKETTIQDPQTGAVRTALQPGLSTSPEGIAAS